MCVDESNGRVTGEEKRKVGSIGEIVLYFYYVEALEHVSPANVPRSMGEDGLRVSQKALKERVARGDEVTFQTRYVANTTTLRRRKADIRDK